MKSSKRLRTLDHEFGILLRQFIHASALEDAAIRRAYRLMQSPDFSTPPIRKQFMAALREFYRWKAKRKRLDVVLGHVAKGIRAEKWRLKCSRGVPLTLTQAVLIERILREKGVRIG